MPNGIYFYDGVTPANVFQAVSGLVGKQPFGIAYYLNGRDSAWPQDAIVKAHQLTPYTLGIDVENEGIGDVLDMENGAAAYADLPGWLLKRRADPQQIIVPAGYCALDSWDQPKQAVTDAGIDQPPYWIAHATGISHLEPGSAATQWGFIGPYDVSLATADWPWPSPTQPTARPDLEVPIL